MVAIIAEVHFLFVVQRFQIHYNNIVSLLHGIVSLTPFLSKVQSLHYVINIICECICHPFVLLKKEAPALFVSVHLGREDESEGPACNSSMCEEVRDQSL